MKVNTFNINFDYYVASSSIAAIFISLFARFISILIPFCVLSRFRKLNFKLLGVLTWSGLKGGVSIALALNIDGNYHDFIVAMTYIVVMFSMLCQGTSISNVLKIYLGRFRI